MQRPTKQKAPRTAFAARGAWWAGRPGTSVVQELTTQLLDALSIVEREARRHLRVFLVIVERRLQRLDGGGSELPLRLFSSARRKISEVW